MTHARRTRTVAVAAAVAVLAACGDDGPTAPRDSLTASEVEAMMSAFLAAGSIGFDVLDFGEGWSQAPAASSGSFSIEQTVPCPEGGSIDFAGQAEVDEEEGSVRLEFVQVHHACAVSAPSDGSEWVFDGSPNVQTRFVLSVTEEAFELEGAQSGGIAWQTAGRSGTCGIDLAYSLSGSESAGSFAGGLSGSVCGVDLSRTFDLSS